MQEAEGVKVQPIPPPPPPPPLFTVLHACIHWQKPNDTASAVSKQQLPCLSFVRGPGTCDFKKSKTSGRGSCNSCARSFTCNAQTCEGSDYGYNRFKRQCHAMMLITETRKKKQVQADV